jgi:antitoxin component YwqK of YwqJK toxin-antitoxin module
MIANWSLTNYDGRTLLQGPDQFFYPNGKLMYSANFYLGHKTGDERYLREDGTPFWEKHYAADGTWTLDNFDASGKRIAESNWRGKTLLDSDVPDPPARNKPAEKPPGPDSE